MAYTFATNISTVPGAGGTHRREQNTIRSWWQRHSFTAEIGTVPVSIHALIEAQAVNGNPIKRMAGRTHVAFSSPQESGNSLIYGARCPDKQPDAVAPLSEFSIALGGFVDQKASPRMDFELWVLVGTASIVITELG